MAVEKRNTIQWRCSPMVWLWKNVHQNIQAQTMVITKEYLNKLDGDRHVYFPGNSAKLNRMRSKDRSYLTFTSVLRYMKIACTGRPTVDKKEVHKKKWHKKKVDKKEVDKEVDKKVQIPETISNGSVYVIRVVGPCGGFKFNNRLMAEQGTNYLLAIERSPGEWHEVKKSKYPIEGAHTLPFSGNYSELHISKLATGKIKLGFQNLIWHLKKLVRGSNDPLHFFGVCVNLFEPARYPAIAKYMFQDLEDELAFNPYVSNPLTPTLLFLIYNWDKISGLVIEYQRIGVWRFNFYIRMNIEDDEDDLPEEEGQLLFSSEEIALLINKTTVHENVAMVKYRKIQV